MIVLGRQDAGYPTGLRELRPPPDPLWVVGDISALARDAVAIVGTRRMTPYGERVARELAGAAARAGLVVVSGLASGIDTVAHEGALDAGGQSIAVLGQGHQTFAPAGRRRRVASRIPAAGCIVSQYAPDSGGEGWRFARRNATIAALARLVVIVEAPLGSGALITARAARLLRRPVFAAPGPLGAFASAGTNLLIARGEATVLLGPESLGWSQLAHRSEPDDLGRAGLEPEAILDRLAAGALPPDAIGADSARVAALLLQGRIVLLPDGRLARV